MWLPHDPQGEAAHLVWASISCFPTLSLVLRPRRPQEMLTVLSPVEFLALPPTGLPLRDKHEEY